MEKPTPTNVTIRPARPEDASLAAGLIYLTMGVEADWLFGREPGFTTLAVLSRLFQYKTNRIGYAFSYIAAWNGQDVGLLVVYPGQILQRMNWMTGLRLAQIFGLGGTLRVARIQPVYGDLVEAYGDEFFISNVAVLADFQGRGVGKALMGHVEKLAMANGLRKCSLIVAYSRQPARRLYAKIGYETVEQFDITHPQAAEGSGGFYRMVKQLDGAIV